MYQVSNGLHVLLNLSHSHTGKQPEVMAEVSHALTGLVSNVAESWQVGDDDLICERVKVERSYTFGRKVHGKLLTTSTNLRSEKYCSCSRRVVWHRVYIH